MNVVVNKKKWQHNSDDDNGSVTFYNMTGFPRYTLKKSASKNQNQSHR